jgi:hypothetical protein
MFDTLRRTKTYDIESETVEETLEETTFTGKRPEEALEEPFEELLEDEDALDELVGTYEGVLEDQRGRERAFHVNVTKRGGGLIAGGGIIAPIPTEYEAEASVEPTPAVNKTLEALERTGNAASRAGAVTTDHTLVPAGRKALDGMEQLGEGWESMKQAVYEAAAEQYQAEVHLLREEESYEDTVLGLGPSEARQKVKKDAKRAVDDIRHSPSVAYRIESGDQEQHYKITSSCAPGSHSWSTRSEPIDEAEYNDLIEEQQ